MFSNFDNYLMRLAPGGPFEAKLISVLFLQNLFSVQAKVFKNQHLFSCVY